jgi:5-(carboxyamino)imidazole ribonucleotide mutase
VFLHSLYNPPFAFGTGSEHMAIAKASKQPELKRASAGNAVRRAPAKAVAKRRGAGRPVVGIIMGSQSDWQTMHHAATILEQLGVTHETRIVSAHRTPRRMIDYAETARSRGIKVIIAGAGGAAHLPGMTASLTDLPVLGVPIESKTLKGMDSLLSIVQMPAGIPVGTLAIGEAGARNAGILAAKILALADPKLAARVAAFARRQTDSIPESVEDA